jgi:predicted nucleic acid-binding protein
VPRCRDESDLPFLHLAVAARADALVGGDADLLALAGKLKIPVLTPEGFAAMFAVDVKVSLENELQPRQAPDRRQQA